MVTGEEVKKGSAEEKLGKVGLLFGFAIEEG